MGNAEDHHNKLPPSKPPGDAYHRYPSHEPGKSSSDPPPPYEKHAFNLDLEGEADYLASLTNHQLLASVEMIYHIWVTTIFDQNLQHIYPPTEEMLVYLAKEAIELCQSHRLTETHHYLQQRLNHDAKLGQTPAQLQMAEFTAEYAKHALVSHGIVLDTSSRRIHNSDYEEYKLNGTPYYAGRWESQVYQAKRYAQIIFTVHPKAQIKISHSDLYHRDGSCRRAGVECLRNTEDLEKYFDSKKLDAVEWAGPSVMEPVRNITKDLKSNAMKHPRTNGTTYEPKAFRNGPYFLPMRIKLFVDDLDEVFVVSLHTGLEYTFKELAKSGWPRSSVSYGVSTFTKSGCFGERFIPKTFQQNPLKRAKGEEDELDVVTYWYQAEFKRWHHSLSAFGVDENLRRSLVAAAHQKIGEPVMNAKIFQLYCLKGDVPFSRMTDLMDKESGPAFDQDCQQQKLFEAWMDKRKEAKLKKDNFPNYPPENMKNVKTGSPSPTRRGFARNHRIQEEASQKEYFEQIREASNFVLPAHATSTLITALEKNPKKRREDILKRLEFFEAHGYHPLHPVIQNLWYKHQDQKDVPKRFQTPIRRDDGPLDAVKTLLHTGPNRVHHDFSTPEAPQEYPLKDLEIQPLYYHPEKQSQAPIQVRSPYRKTQEEWIKPKTHSE